MTRWGR